MECSTIADVGRPTVGDRRAEVCGVTELPFSSCAVRESRLWSLDAEGSGDVVADVVGVPGSGSWEGRVFPPAAAPVSGGCRDFPPASVC